MSSSSDPNLNAWVRHWRDADRALRVQKATELRLLNNPAAEQDGRASAEHVAAIVALGSWYDFACRHARSTETSGLVEHQRVFARLAKR